MEKTGDDSFKNANETILLIHLPPGCVGLPLLPISELAVLRVLVLLWAHSCLDRMFRMDGRPGGGKGSMLSLATCCLFHSKPPFLPTLQPELPSPHSSPSPVDRAGIRSHLPNAFLMLSLILHRQHLREQNPIFSSALSCALYRKAQECLLLVGSEGRAGAMAGQEAALGKPEAVPKESTANPMELEFGTGTG